MVNLINCDVSDFCGRIKDKKLVCFGAGLAFDAFFKRHSELKLEHKIESIVDNDESLSGAVKFVNDVKLSVVSCRRFLETDLSDVVILITNYRNFDEILTQLDNEDSLNGIECYISVLLEYCRYKSGNIEFTKGKHNKIPKKIHYCWFGGNPIPAHLQKFMESWRKFCPDYEIIRWDESNYDVSKNLYMKQAYDAKKWGFVPDYARLDIIYNNGGVYLDTDVELLKPLDDLLYDDMFCGFESNSHIALGLGFGAIKGYYITKRLMDKYDDLLFINRDGSLNLTPSPAYQSEIIKNNGFKLNNTYQNIDGAVVYPCEVLAPISYLELGDIFTKNTHSIHHFDASWKEDNERKKNATTNIKFKNLMENRCI